MIIFHQPQKKISKPNIKLNYLNITYTDTFDFRGITLDKHLKWIAHVNIIALKISKTIGFLKKMKCCLPLNTRIHIYNSLIISNRDVSPNGTFT